jgi:hypothetical protein
MLGGEIIQGRLIKVLLQQRGQNESRPDGVDSDAVGSMLPGGRLGDAHDTVLGRNVGTRHGETHLAEDRSHIDH